MVTITVSCRYCGNPDQVRRKGLTTNGHQRYKCEACKRSFQLAYTHRAHEPGIKEQVIEMALNGSGIRDTARVLTINMNTVMSTLKKKPKQSSL
jgi:transposase